MIEIIDQQLIDEFGNIVSALYQMKLSQIGTQHADNHTDRLYQPLRKAISAYPQHPQPLQNIHPQSLRTDIRRSCMDFTGLQPQLIKETTLIPQNMRLVQTNNPLKRFKARSRSYKAISVQERVLSPVTSALMKEVIGPKAASKKEIVYDYQPGQYQQKMPKQNTPIMGQNADYRLPGRARSATFLGPILQTFANRVERVQSKTITVENKQSKHFSNPSTKASIQLYEDESISNAHKNKESKKHIKEMKNSQHFSDYYQDCKRYTFDKKMKSPRANEEGGYGGGLELSPRSNSYKYNLFSMMDEQANTHCATGFCMKNEAEVVSDLLDT